MKTTIRASELRASYDVVVIGAGISGMVCGGFLAKAGRSVLVLDHHYLPGGLCTAFRRRKYLFDAAVHHIGGCSRLGIVGQVVSRLKAEVNMVRLDPMDHLVFPEFEFRIPADMARYQETLCERFPTETPAIRRFFSDLVQMYRQILNRKQTGPLVERYRGQSFGAMLDDYLDAPDLKRILGGQWGYLGCPVERISALGMCQMLVNYLKDGAYYPIGSTQAFSDAIAEALLRMGAHVCLRQAVTEVLVDRNRAVGVRLDSGQTIRSQQVVGALDVRQLLGDLVPEGACAPERIRIEKLETSSSYFGLYVALSPEIDLGPLRRGFYHFPESNGAIDWIYLSVTTEVDPQLASDGGQILSATVGVRPGSTAYRDWNVDKDAMVEAAFSYLDSHVPGIREHVLLVESASPATIARYTRSRDGAAYGWAVTPDQAASDRFSQTTSLPGLALTGQWTPPGPGVCATAASGWMAANTLLTQSEDCCR